MSVNIKRPEEPDLLRITALADRWGVPLLRARQIVKEMQVPFIRLAAPTKYRIAWDLILFRRESIEQWERDQQQVFRTPSAPRPIPVGMDLLGRRGRFAERDRERERRLRSQ